MEHNLYEIKKSLSRMDENTHNLSKEKPEPYKSETIDEVIIRFSNVGHFPKPTQRIISSSKQHCVGDYSCCGHVP
jgi:hypothetical protein